jgi:hypothetical protein
MTGVNRYPDKCGDAHRPVGGIHLRDRRGRAELGLTVTGAGHIVAAPAAARDGIGMTSP